MEQLKQGLREAAKQIYSTSHNAELSEDNLDHLILQTGYEGLTQPFENTAQLFDLFARNIRNSAGNGLSFNAFGQLIYDSVQPFIQNNQLQRYNETDFIQSICQNAQVQKLPEKYIQDLNTYATWVCDPSHNKPDWIQDLSKKPRIIRDLDSVIDFMTLLRRHYDGCAATFSKKLRNEFKLNDQSTAVKQSIFELLQIRGMGLALAANFLKDSQVGHITNKPRTEWKEHYATSFVKPDKHVLRLMHLITHRSSVVNRDQLLQKNDSELQRSYFKKVPPTGSAWPEVQNSEFYFSGIESRGQWRCIQDVLHFAVQANTSPLELDRLMYFCGSGKFDFAGLPDGHDPRQLREQRYSVIEQCLNL